MVTTLLILVGVGVLAGGAIWGIVKAVNYYSSGSKGIPNVVFPVVLFVLGLLWAIGASTGAAHVDGTDRAVVENTVTGQFSQIGPGTHVFPFQPKLIPFVTHVSKYTLRFSVVEVGEPDAGKPFERVRAVQADSNSPGRPAVYFWTRVWAAPNEENLIELHKRYGPNYLHEWTERVYIASLKAVQGKNEYYYVGQNRVGFQGDVEKALQAELLDEKGTPIVFVKQLAVVNFDFSDPTNQFLQTVQKIEFDRQQAEQQIAVNTKKQAAEKIAAETSYIVETRNAERDRDARVSRASGDSQAVKLAADGEKYRISETYFAEAEGIKKVQGALAASPAAYLEYQKTRQWDGHLPQYMLGSGVVPFIDINPDGTKKK